MREDWQEVISLIEKGVETTYVDFKRDFYRSLKGTDFPKDICAFANLTARSDRYIIFGVDDKTRQVVGIRPETVPTVDTMDNYLSNTVEPFINIDVDMFEYKGKTVAYIKISKHNEDQPYVIKENCGSKGKLEKGDVYIRKGTCNLKANRMDLDRMYKYRGGLDIKIYDDTITLKTGSKSYGTVYVDISNSKTVGVLIPQGQITLKCGKEIITRNVISILPSIDIKSHPTEIQAHSRKIYTLLFEMPDAKSQEISLDEKTATLKVYLYDTDGGRYTSPVKEVAVKVIC